jgi:hypothetical protein
MLEAPTADDDVLSLLLLLLLSLPLPVPLEDFHASCMSHRHMARKRREADDAERTTDRRFTLHAGEPKGIRSWNAMPSMVKRG